MRLEGKTVSLTVVTRETSRLFWKQQDEKISEIFLVNKLVVIEEKKTNMYSSNKINFCDGLAVFQYEKCQL